MLFRELFKSFIIKFLTRRHQMINIASNCISLRLKINVSISSTTIGIWTENNKIRLRNCLVCETSIIGVSNHETVPDHRFSASSIYFSGYTPHKARFTSTGWSTTAAGRSNAWLRIDLGSAYFLCAIATNGSGYVHTEWVSEYKVHYTMDNTNWQVYVEDHKVKVR